MDQFTQSVWWYVLYAYVFDVSGDSFVMLQPRAESFVELAHLVFWRSVVRGDWTGVVLILLYVGVYMLFAFWVVTVVFSLCIFLYRFRQCQSSDWLWRLPLNWPDCVGWGVKLYSNSKSGCILKCATQFLQIVLALSSNCQNSQEIGSEDRLWNDV